MRGERHTGTGGAGRAPGAHIRAFAVAIVLAAAGLLALQASGGLAASARTASAKAPRPCANAKAPAAPGSAEPPPAALLLTASLARVGCIELTVRASAQTPVTIVERPVAAPGAPEPVATVAPANGRASVDPGVPWRCDRSARTFEAQQTLADGAVQSASVTVATPSCDTRLAVKVARTRLHRGYPVSVTAVDHWHLGGLRVRACLPHRRGRVCAVATIAPGASRAQLTPDAPDGGSQLLTVSDSYQTLRVPLLVHSGPVLLLATGDSQMQVLDDLIDSDLSGSGVRVSSDAKQSTAISSPFFFDWPAHAVAQVAARHPDIVAMFLGGNEGFPFGSDQCCGAAWTHEYANRVAGMIDTYRQGGAASVYWFLIPTPSREPYVRVARAVDAGIELAVGRFHEGVHVVDLRPQFSPGGRYINSLTSGGRTITVHEADGFHLSTASDAIVARQFVDRLRGDGLIR